MCKKAREKEGKAKVKKKKIIHTISSSYLKCHEIKMSSLHFQWQALPTAGAARQIVCASGFSEQHVMTNSHLKCILHRTHMSFREKCYCVGGV